HAFDPGVQTLTQLESERFDRAFIALHGRGGEDGTIQGVLEYLGVPYTGSGVMACALALDKCMTKRLWMDEDLPTPEWCEVDSQTDWLRVIAELGEDLIVKPAHEGSSLGLAKVHSHDGVALAQAYAAAAQHDAQVLVEKRIEGRELTCAILGQGASARALPLVEIIAPDANYDFHHKYVSDATRYVCPAQLDETLTQDIQQLCLRAYRLLGARGWGRVDVMLGVDPRGDRPFLLELNTAPGMTTHSLVPIAAQAAGLSYDDLVMEILASASLDGLPPMARSAQAASGGGGAQA
nr:D-alanine--D-alanine ligase [Burkholderiaceae bacterium]